MAERLSDTQRNELKRKLQNRFQELQEQVRQELRESDNARYIELAGRVHDAEEESLADLLVDLDLAIIDLHIEEIRDIEDALMRFPKGTYGFCVDCGTNIDFRRLQAYPAAKRCLDCQAKHERIYAEKGHPSL